MATFKVIACINKKGVMGNDGSLLYHIKNDMANFQRITDGNVVIMGRRTFESLPDGLTYKFKNHYGSHNFELCEFSHTQAEIDELNAKINALRGQKPEVVEKIVTKEVVKTVTERTGDVVVFFAKNSSYLDNNAIEVLDRIPVDGVVKIVGKASIDGSFERNQELSVERADAVKRYLENRGVEVLNSVGIGASEGEASGRVVVVTLQ